jgi:hypothetical protein
MANLTSAECRLVEKIGKFTFKLDKISHSLGAMA